MDTPEAEIAAMSLETILLKTRTHGEDIFQIHCKDLKVKMNNRNATLPQGEIAS